jgi:transposase
LWFAFADCHVFQTIYHHICSNQIREFFNGLLGVLAELPELGTLNRRQAAALAGLAPHPRESGQWHGRRSIGGGRAPVRRALYMAALVAAHSNRQLKEFYQRLRAAGKPAKVALTAVMRKLIVLMNHILKNPNFALQN